MKDSNKEYNEFYPQWKKNTDCYNGQEAVKTSSNAMVYLPMLSGQTNTTYSTYKEYANFFNAVKKTAEGFKGLVFRKKPIINIEESDQYLFDNIDLQGNNLEGFVKGIFTEIELKNRVGVLLEMPKAPDGITRADAELLNIRPYLVEYKAENILDWNERVINNVKQVDYVKLYEVSREVIEKNNEYESIEVERIRILKLYQGVYIQELYIFINEKWELEEEIIPLINGNTLNYIPFYCLTDNGLDWELSPSMVNDLSNVNISLYRDDANYRNGLILTGNPTPCFKDLLNDDESVSLGSANALQFGINGNSWFLEFSGAGLSELRTSMENLKNEMAILGAKVLVQDKKMTETATTAMINRSGEHSILADLSNSLSVVFTDIGNRIIEWTGSDNEMSISLNTDYMPSGLTAQDITANMNAFLQGGLSGQELFEVFQKGELINASKEYEEHLAEIEESDNSII